MLENLVPEERIKSFDEVKVLEYMEEQFKTKKVVSFERILAATIKTYNPESHITSFDYDIKKVIHSVDDMAKNLGYEKIDPEKSTKRGYILKK